MNPDVRQKVVDACRRAARPEASMTIAHEIGRRLKLVKG
jgi:hypothetical protein